MSFEIKIDGLEKLKEGLAKAPQVVANEMSAAIKDSVGIIRPMMRRQAPVASGKLSRNIYARSSGLTGEVGPDLAETPYAIFVHEGTKAHEIRPVTKKALYWKGALHPVRLVHHPGTKANPFVERTAQEAEPVVNRIFGVKIENIVRQIAG